MSESGSTFPEPPKGLLRMLGLMTKAEHERIMSDQREAIAGPSSQSSMELAEKKGEIASLRADLAARTAEANDLRRREGILMERLKTADCKTDMLLGRTQVRAPGGTRLRP